MNLVLTTIEKLKLLEWFDEFLTKRIRMIERELPKIKTEDLRWKYEQILQLYQEEVSKMQQRRIMLAKKV